MILTIALISGLDTLREKEEMGLMASLTATGQLERSHFLDFLRRTKIVEIEYLECVRCHRVTGVESSLTSVDTSGSYRIVKRRLLHLCPECRVVENGFRIPMLFQKCLGCGMILGAQAPQTISESMEKKIVFDRQISFVYCQRCVNRLNTGRAVTREELSIR